MNVERHITMHICVCYFTYIHLYICLYDTLYRIQKEIQNSLYIMSFYTHRVLFSLLEIDLRIHFILQSNACCSDTPAQGIKT